MITIIAIFFSLFLYVSLCFFTKDLEGSKLMLQMLCMKNGANRLQDGAMIVYALFPCSKCGPQGLHNVWVRDNFIHLINPINLKAQHSNCYTSNMLAHDAAHRIDWKILFYTVLGCVVLVDSTAFISFFAIPIGTNDTDVLMQLFTENGVDGVTILHNCSSYIFQRYSS